MRKTLVLIGLLTFIMFSCNNDEETAVISQEAEDFLNEVLDLMENNSVKRNTIDWAEFREQVFATAQGAQTIEETEPALRLALEMLGDNHSRIILASGPSLFEGSLVCDPSPGLVGSIPSDIGYIKVSGFNDGGDAAVLFAQNIQDSIRLQDKESLKGWIVDLRGNLGGNMWPMLAGIGPVLGEGVAGYFIFPDGREQPWGYSDGASIGSEIVVVQVEDSYELINNSPRVAVLTDRGVASAGEAIAISFEGRENTRSFGIPTCGLSTVNSLFQLRDGSRLILTVGTFADRNKNLFGSSINPDVRVEDATDVMSIALEWLTEQ